MTITEHTTNRLVLEHQRPMAFIVLAIFTLLSGVMLVSVVGMGLLNIATLRPWQWIGWITWTSFALAMMLIGAITWSKTGRGVILIFDREDETLLIRRPRLRDANEDNYSIYSVSHMDVERNDEVRVVGVFLVLKSGERLALATAPLNEEAEVRALAKQVRDFLRQS